MEPKDIYRHGTPSCAPDFYDTYGHLAAAVTGWDVIYEVLKKEFNTVPCKLKELLWEVRVLRCDEGITQMADLN